MGLFTLAIMMVPIILTILISISPFIILFMWIVYHVRRNEEICKLNEEKIKKQKVLANLLNSEGASRIVVIKRVDDPVM